MLGFIKLWGNISMDTLTEFYFCCPEAVSISKTEWIGLFVLIRQSLGKLSCLFQLALQEKSLYAKIYLFYAEISFFFFFGEIFLLKGRELQWKLFLVVIVLQCNDFKLYFFPIILYFPNKWFRIVMSWCCYFIFSLFSIGLILTIFCEWKRAALRVMSYFVGLLVY